MCMNLSRHFECLFITNIRRCICCAQRFVPVMLVPHSLFNDTVLCVEFDVIQTGV